MSHTEIPSDSRSPSELVVEAIADHAGVDPLELEVPLGQVIDPDALNALFTSPLGEHRHSGTLEFDYQSYRVTVVSEQDDGVSVDVASASEGTTTAAEVGAQEA